MFYLFYIGEINNGSKNSELTIFNEYLALLCNMITDVIDPLITCFVEDKLFTTEERKEITAVMSAPEKLQLVLLKISNSLNINNSKGFYVMLKIMKEHGNKGTQSLANLMLEKSKISSETLSYIFCFCIHTYVLIIMFCTFVTMYSNFYM